MNEKSFDVTESQIFTMNAALAAIADDIKALKAGGAVEDATRKIANATNSIYMTLNEAKPMTRSE